jgi:hypothetical protein
MSGAHAQVLALIDASPQSLVNHPSPLSFRPAVLYRLVISLKREWRGRPSRRTQKFI